MTGYSLGELYEQAQQKIRALETELAETRRDRDNAETGRLTDTITAARDLAVHNRDRAEQAAEQVRRIHAQPVADAFAELAELLGDEA